MPDTPDLWPTDIATSNFVTPAALLKEQAALLGHKTRQLVKAEVVSQASGQSFVHRFFIVAPTLNYKYELFAISHDISFYPMQLSFQSTGYTVTSEAELLSWLKRIFNNDRTKNIVRSILAQVQT